MSLNLIRDLQGLKPKARVRALQRQYQRNLKYLSQQNAKLGEVLEKVGTGRYTITVTDDFLTIKDRTTGKLLHPPSGAAQYARELGAPYHDKWIDHMTMLEKAAPGYEHGELLRQSAQDFYAVAPAVKAQMLGGEISLPACGRNRVYAGATVFLGIASGLHIAEYLRRAEVRDVYLIEPDIELFALSCRFLDYAAIERRFGHLHLHVGPNLPEEPLIQLAARNRVTARVWVRMLPAYPLDKYQHLIDRTRLRIRSLNEIFVPLDRELQGLANGRRNLAADYAFLNQEVDTRAGMTAVVAGAGPSLDGDLAWLKDHRDGLVIFAAVSAVRALEAAGVRPDFQVALDTDLTDEVMRNLELPRDIPLLVYYKANSRMLALADTAMMFVESNKANCAKFQQSLTGTHPTSGNAAFALACASGAERVLLCGMDLAYNAKGRSHASHTHHDDRISGEETGLPIAANFEGRSETLLTTPYYNAARFSLESHIAARSAIDVINCSDGAQVKGASPTRIANVAAPASDGRADAEAFKGAFGPAEYADYPIDSARLMAIVMGCFELFPQRLDWPRFATALDQFPVEAMQRIDAESPGDLRYDAIAGLIADLFAHWYRVMCLAPTEDEQRALYAEGLAKLPEMIGSIEWEREPK